jgi:protein-disulfide isomerase
MAKTQKKEESNDEVVISLDSFAVPGAILIAGVLIAVAVFVSNRNKTTDDVDVTATDNTAEETDSAVDQEQFPAASAPVGDSPFIGDQNAQVAIVEFNEYRCGFCVRHKDETLPSIIENYIDTGKIKYVFKEFAIYGDDAANAAKCVYHIEGIDKYLDFHKGIFDYENDDDIYALVKELGVNESQFDTCYSDREYQDEVDADKEAGTNAGVQGTPGFVIGTIDEDGNVTGNLVPGAYPYENFVELLDGFLSE